MNVARFHEAPGHPVVMPGDIVFGRGPGGLGPVIRWAETSRGEAPTFTNHTLGVTWPGYLVPPAGGRVSLAWVSESQWKVVHREFWAGYRNSPGYQVAAYRPRHLGGEIEAVVADWLSRTGAQYGFWRLFSHLGEKLTGGLVPFTKLHRKGWLRVCSHHIASGFAAKALPVGLSFGKPPERLSPDDMLDYCNANPDEWEYVGWAIVPGRVA